MSRHIVCLSFDFDAWSGLVARGLTTPTPVSRGEFGIIGVQRILKLLAERQIQASWFVPGIVIQTYRNVCDRIMQAEHEIGNHGWTHAIPTTLSAAEEAEGFERSNEFLKQLTGRAPAGYRSPSWDISDRTVALLLKHGFLYESSLMGNDYHPYFVRSGDIVAPDAAPIFGKRTSLIEMPISWSLDDFPHFEFLRTSNQIMPGLMNARNVLDNWIVDYEYMTENYDWGVITYTFHPYVIGRGHRMKVLTELIDTLAKKGAIFTTLEKAALEFKEKADQGQVEIYP